MRVEKVSDLTTAWTSAMPAYKGMIVTVMETSEVYVLKDADNYTNIASWVKLGSADAATANTANALKEAKKYTDTEVGKLANGSVKTNTDKIAILNGTVETEGSVAYAVAAEKSRAEGKEGELKTAIDNEKAARIADDEAINTKIGDVAENKTVVQMIADAETAAKAAATKMKLATSEAFLTLESTTDSSGATTYALGTKDLASDAELQTEKERALAAEGKLQTQIGKAATEQGGPTGLHKEIADVKAAYETAIDAMDATVGTTTVENGKHVAVQVVEENGVITDVTVTESDIASKQALDDEVTRAKAAEKANADDIKTLKGSDTTPGSVAKAVADAKKALLGDAAEEYNTLGKLEDKIIAVSGAAKTYRIAQVVGDELTSLGANVKEAYKLVENGKTDAGEYIKVYKDSALQSVALVGQELQFTYLLADGSTSTVGVDVSKFLAESEFANGLQVIDHIVSVKRDATSEGFLTVGADGIKLSGVQSAIDTAKKAVTDRLDVIEGKDVGSIKKALADAKDYASGYTDTKIASLHADVTSAEGTKVRVQVVETSGKITDVTVTDVDIASATGLTAEINARTAADNAIKGRLDKIEGSGEGSVAKALVDAKAYTDTKITEEETARTNAVNTAKTDLIGNATSDYDTLGKLEGKIKDTEAAAKAAATKIAAKTTGHVTVSSSKDETTSALTYTISETDIASAQELDALEAVVGTGFTTGDTVANHIAVLEGVKVTGKDAIVVSSSDAKTNKEVSLKLGTQPAEGVAGVVLSQDANGLVAKLYWGAF